MRDAAKIEGIPPDAIFLDMKSTSTYEDAVNTKEMLQAHGWKSAIIVSTMYHMRRSRMIFEKVYADSGIYLQYYPAQSETYRPNGWWMRERDMVYVVVEYLKLMLYWVKY